MGTSDHRIAGIGDRGEALSSTINLPATLGLGFSSGEDTIQPIVLEIQPRIPFRLNDDWRIVTRSDVSIVHVSGPPVAAPGLSDLNVEAFFAPADTEKWIWGVGPIVALPAATRTLFGEGKWSVGPTVGLVYVAGPS